MSPRRQHNLYGIMGAAGFFVLSMVGRYLTPWLMVLAIVWALWLELKSRKIRCPACGAPIRANQFSVLGLKLPAVRPYVSRDCHQCGWDLSR